jgi:hypothetical protein
MHPDRHSSTNQLVFAPELTHKLLTPHRKRQLKHGPSYEKTNNTNELEMHVPAGGAHTVLSISILSTLINDLCDTMTKSSSSSHSFAYLRKQASKKTNARVQTHHIDRFDGIGSDLGPSK